MIDLLTCSECGRDVPREDAFPSGDGERICRECRDAKREKTAAPAVVATLAAAEKKRLEAEQVKAAGCWRCGQSVEDGEQVSIRDKGWQWTCRACLDQDAAETKRLRDEHMEREAEKEIAKHIGRRYAGCTRENLELDPGIAPLLWPAVGAKRSLLLTGANGTGKTHAAAAIMREALIAGRMVWFATAAGMVSELKAAIESNTVEKVIRRAREIDLLLLDDLAMERPTEWVLEMLTSVIDWRYRDDRQTVVTSNLKLEALRRRYGDRFWSRLAGLAGANIFRFTGRDRRQDEMRQGVEPTP